jgi:hypothetical protein
LNVEVIEDVTVPELTALVSHRSTAELPERGLSAVQELPESTQIGLAIGPIAVDAEEP